MQVGVDVPNATETVARKVRLWTRQDGADEMVMQIDLKNAFNSIDRSKMLAEIKARTPLLYPYAAVCYSDNNLIFGSGYELESSRGVQQGDVCGPFCCWHSLDRPQTRRNRSAVSVLVLG